MQKITTHLWFDREAKEAAKFYTSVFPNSKILSSSALDGTPSGMVDILNIKLFDHEFTLINAGSLFKFNEAISFVVHCMDQKEIDYYWEKLSAMPKAEQCGWLKDKFGVSWQIVPVVLDQMIRDGSKDQIDRVTQEFLKMKKFDIALLQQAYEGK